MSCAFCGGPVGAICGEEVFHGGSNFDDVRLRRKMSGIEELNLRARYVFAERLRSCGDEKGIVLAPDRKQGRLRFTEIFLKFRIKLYVRRVIQKQIELNLSVPRTLEQRRIQCVRLRRNTLWICYAVGVLPARSSRGQNTLAEDVPVLCRGGYPVLPDRAPSFTKAFFVCIPVLRNDRCNRSGWAIAKRKPVGAP